MNLIEKLDHYISESSHFGDPLYDAWPKLRAIVIAAKLAEMHLNAYQMKDTGLTDALGELDKP